MSMTNLYFDLEVIPGCQWYQEQAAAAVRPPSNYRSEDAIEKWWKEVGQAAKLEAIHRTCFIPAYGQIVCIGWALDDGPTEYLVGEDEAILLGRFFTHLEETLPNDRVKHLRWIGHNISGFDIPYLRMRCILHGIKSDYLPEHGIKPWDTSKVFDTLGMLAGRDTKGYSLGNMAKLFGIIDPMENLDGSMVWEMWKSGLHNAVGEYCANDVSITRSLYNRIKEFYE